MKKARDKKENEAKLIQTEAEKSSNIDEDFEANIEEATKKTSRSY